MSIVANAFPGPDIFAQINVAMAANPGAVIEVNPGNYVVATPLVNNSGAKIKAQCVSVAYSGTLDAVTVSGPASELSGLSVEYVGKQAVSGLNLLYGDCHRFDDLQFQGFDKGINIDGQKSGTYYNSFTKILCERNRVGLNIVPSQPNYANANWFYGFNFSANTQDGIVIDGGYGNGFFGGSVEANGRYGCNFTGKFQTSNNTFNDVWFESNPSGDLCFGSFHVSSTKVYGGILQSPYGVVGNPFGWGNAVHVEAGLWQYLLLTLVRKIKAKF